MKSSDLADIIDINEEYKVYRRMENNKSARFKRYSDWENHISSMISKFSSAEDLYDFKIYCDRFVRWRKGYFDTAFNFMGILVAIAIAIDTTIEFRFWGVFYGFAVIVLYLLSLKEKRTT